MAGDSGSAPRSTYTEATLVLDVNADANGDLVLVGGQALNYWAEVYAPVCRPFAQKRRSPAMTSTSSAGRLGRPDRHK